MNEHGYKLIHGDCLEEMKNIPDGSVDLCLTDPPYGTTACKWDSVIPFEPMWKELKRIVKPKGAICLFGSQPFTSALVMSNPKMFRYEWIWHKTMGTNPALLKYQPFKKHENVILFSVEAHHYHPQYEQGKPYIDKRITAREKIGVHGLGSFTRKPIENTGTRNPSSVQLFANPNHGNLHPTQKPVELLRYLIRTYTQERETVLDFTMGSGSTGVACLLENRKFIGIEKDANYFQIAQDRIASTIQKQPLFANA